MLAKTSSPSSVDVQDLILQNGEALFIHLASTLARTRSADNLWFVVGGTQTDAIKDLRAHCPNNTFLIPGVGSQGGDVEAIVEYGMRVDGMGIAINVSRGITSPKQRFTDLSEYIELIRDHACHFYHLIKQAREQARLYKCSV